MKFIVILLALFFIIVPAAHAETTSSLHVNMSDVKQVELHDGNTNTTQSINVTTITQEPAKPVEENQQAPQIVKPQTFRAVVSPTVEPTLVPTKTPEPTKTLAKNTSSENVGFLTHIVEAITQPFFKLLSLFQ